MSTCSQSILTSSKSETLFILSRPSHAVLGGYTYATGNFSLESCLSSVVFLKKCLYESDVIFVSFWWSKSICWVYWEGLSWRKTGFLRPETFSFLVLWITWKKRLREGEEACCWSYVGSGMSRWIMERGNCYSGALILSTLILRFRVFIGTLLVCSLYPYNMDMRRCWCSWGVSLYLLSECY